LIIPSTIPVVVVITPSLRYLPLTQPVVLDETLTDEHSVPNDKFETECRGHGWRKITAQWVVE
jgi:hypothetical protein